MDPNSRCEFITFNKVVVDYFDEVEVIVEKYLGDDADNCQAPPFDPSNPFQYQENYISSTELAPSAATNVCGFRFEIANTGLTYPQLIIVFRDASLLLQASLAVLSLIGLTYLA